MNTFLIIIGIIFALVVIAAVAAGLFISKIVAKGAVFVIRKGTAHALSRTEPEWVPADVRAEITKINEEALALPEPGFFNAKSVLRRVKDLTLRVAAELEKLEAAAPAPEPTPEPVIDVEAVALPAPAAESVPEAIPSTEPAPASPDAPSTPTNP